MARAAPISACRIERVASTSMMTALSVSTRQLSEQVNTAGPFCAAVHWLAGSGCDTNLGFAGLAAPNAASSRVSRYSRTARGAVRGSMAPASHLAGALEFGLSTSAMMRLASAADPVPPTSPSSMRAAPPRPRRPAAADRCRGTRPVPVLREGRMVRHPAVEAEPAEPAMREVQMHLAAQPALRADARQVSDQQHPHGSAPGRSRGGRDGCGRAQAAPACGPCRGTGRPAAAGDRPARAPQGRSRGTASPAPSARPSSPDPPRPPEPSESGDLPCRNRDFFDEIGSERTFAACRRRCPASMLAGWNARFGG